MLVPMAAIRAAKINKMERRFISWSTFYSVSDRTAGVPSRTGPVPT